MKKCAPRLASIALALVLLGGVLLAGVQGRAQALAPRPPHAILKQDNRALQDGRLISYCWIKGCVDGVSKYPSAVLVEPGTKLHIRLSENRRPNQFSLTSSRSPNAREQQIGNTLRRVQRDGKTVAWDAYFRLGRQYYIGAFGVWKGAGGRRCDAYWQFHVKAGPEAELARTPLQALG